MRSIVSCTTSSKLDKAGLRTILDDLDWVAALNEDDPVVLERKMGILEHIAVDHRSLVEKTFTCTIYDEETKTWGIANQPGTKAVTFRLKNQSSDKLKAATEKLIGQLQTARQTHGPDNRPAFTFQPRVDVFEANSEDHAFYGEILKPRSFRQAVRERKREATIGLVAGIVALLLLLLTSPPVAPLVLGDINMPWGRWRDGYLERVATAALVTMAVSWLEVVMHWLFDLRQPIILWK